MSGQRAALCSAARAALTVLALSALVSFEQGGVAAPPQSESAAAKNPPADDEIATALAQLESDEFSVRHAAAKRLRTLADNPALAARMGEAAEQALLSNKMSLEARLEIEQVLRMLPARAIRDAAPAPVEEIDASLRALAGDSYADRDRARRRLTSLLAAPKSGVPLLAKIEKRLDQPDLAAEERSQFGALWQVGEGAWLLDEKAEWTLPPIAAGQIDTWLRSLDQPGELDPRAGLMAEMAHRRLLNALARDEYRDEVLTKTTQRLGQQSDGPARKRLERLREWTRPAMVAEIWRGRRHVTVQHLLIGVPQFPDAPLAVRATHFDRIDNNTAHCVSGNTLEPGPYPVGVAIPHPEGEGMFFHLVNLPTVRDRLAYEYRLARSEPQRLREISTRTLDRMLADPQKLTSNQIIMLRQLDGQAVSRFVGPYFNRVLPAVSADAIERESQASELSAVCAILAETGTREAVPALEKVARSGSLAPTADRPYEIAWVAALAIARRDPWPEVESWLVSIVGERVSLSLETDTPGDVRARTRTAAADLGGTAAGLLLRRHEMSPRAFGLASTTDQVLARLDIVGYRFTSAEARTRVRSWWMAERQRVARREKP